MIRRAESGSDSALSVSAAALISEGRWRLTQSPYGLTVCNVQVAPCACDHLDIVRLRREQHPADLAARAVISTFMGLKAGVKDRPPHRGSSCGAIITRQLPGGSGHCTPMSGSFQWIPLTAGAQESVTL